VHGFERGHQNAVPFTSIRTARSGTDAVPLRNSAESRVEPVSSSTPNGIAKGALALPV
jgi:hypothetical protein